MNRTSGNTRIARKVAIVATALGLWGALVLVFATPLALTGDVEVIGESGDGFEAVDQIQATRPDLVFLDVQMPEMDGFELLRRVPQASLPVVIFTTAFDQHALRAFEVNALDYLLKPFKPTRFKEAVQRARDLIGNKQAGVAARGLLALLGQTPAPAGQLTRLAVNGNRQH